MRLDDPKKAARRAGLRYVNDESVRGITRHGRPGRFYYRTPKGAKLADKQLLKHIRAMAIPPAWTDVWIAPFANAHLIATGRDAKGRKQYRYHAGFAAVRDAAKYESLARFAANLPALRRALEADLRRPGLPREKVLAGIVTLLEESLIRIGNEEYARANGSFGLTTLRNRHVRVRGDEIKFLFRGKSGKQWDVALRDRRVAKIVRRCQDLPGQHLFEYRNGDGRLHDVSSTDVNDYLRQISGEDITAKDFRTWAGTVAAARAFATFKGDRAAAKAVTDIVAAVAAQLGNTVAVCRKCYIHPGVIAAFQAGELKLKQGRRRRGGLDPVERGVLALLRRGLLSSIPAPR